MPGFGVGPGIALGTENATICPYDTYRGEETLYDPVNGVPCIPCPNSMQTLSDGTTSVNFCLVAPGYGWNATAQMAYQCPIGYYR